MDYDLSAQFRKCWQSKVISNNITVKLRGGISKFTVLGPHTFLHRIKTSGAKIRPALKKSYLFHELEDMKS